MTSTVVAKLGDVAEFVRGVTYKPDAVTTAGDGGAIACMRTKNIQADLEDADLVYIPRAAIDKNKVLRVGDIIVSSANSWNLVGKCSWVPSLQYEATFGGFTSVLRATNSRVLPRYLYRWFSTSNVQALARSFGQQTTNISNLNLKRCLDLLIPLPPLDDQRRIAAILDKADALRRKRKRALELLEGLTQSIFLEMFGDSHLALAGRDVRPLGSITTEIYRYPTYYGIEYEDFGVPEVRGELIQDDGMILADETQLRYISNETSDRFPKTQLAAGDIVMSVRGTIGKVGIVPASLDGANITANLVRIAPDRSKVMPLFLWVSLRTETIRRRLIDATATTTIATIKAPDLRKLPIIVPPLEDQERFCRALAKVTDGVSSAVQHAARIDTLFASLQHRAFSGQL